MPNDASSQCSTCYESLDAIDQELLLGSDTATGSTSETIVTVLAYCSWILPLILLIVSIVTFFVQYNRSERKKQLEQKKIQVKLAEKDLE